MDIIKIMDLHLIVIPWARAVCLIHTPEARGPQAQECIYQVDHKCTWYNYYIPLSCVGKH